MNKTARMTVAFFVACLLSLVGLSPASATIPPDPTGCTATSNGDGTYHIDWNAVTASPAVQYYNVRLTNTSKSWLKVLPPTTDATWTSGIGTQTNPSWGVRAVNADGFSPGWCEAPLSVTPPPNSAPVVSAGPDVSTERPAAATLNGTVSDPDGDPLTTSWTKVSGPGTVTFANAAAVDTTATFSVAGSYVVQLSASDGSLSTTDTATVTVTDPPPVNTAPVVSAGPDKSVQLPSSASLTGTASDADNDPLTTTWSKVSGPSTVTFSNPNALSTSATFGASGSYVLRLSANDGTVTSTDDVTVTVTDPPPPPPSGVNLPTDANLIDLGAAPYNVKCDGVTDNTAAINNAWNTYGNAGTNTATRFSFRTLVLPAGTCLISNTVTSTGSAVRLMGRGETQTILKLKDGATGFGSASTPKNVVQPGIEGTFTGDNAAFSNYVQDMTINVGANNPGAVGLRWAACNTGALSHLTVKAPAGSGLNGISVESNTGSNYARNVTVDGFDTGIDASGSIVNNPVFSDLTLKNQRTVAISNDGRNLQFERLTVTGSPKVYSGTGPQGSAHFIDSTFTGPGSGTAMSTVASAFLYTRGITATGWGNLITQAGTARFVGKTAITEWATNPYRKGNTSVNWTETTPIQSLNLAHPEAPESTNYDLTTWKKAAATSGNNADDDGPAIQAAIDSAGTKVVYLPYGEYTVKTPVIVRGAVEKLDFMGSRLTTANTGKISVGAGTSTFVEIINVSATATFEQNSARQAVFRNAGPIGTSGSTLTTGPNATGDMWGDNYGGNNTVDITKPVHIYMREWNHEGRAGSFSGGATVWDFGENIEAHDGKTPFLTYNNVTAEVIGGALDNLATGGGFNSTTGPAFFQAQDSTVSVSIAGVYRGTAVTGHWLQDKVGTTVVGNVTNSDVVVGAVVGEWKRAVLPLYVSP